MTDLPNPADQILASTAYEIIRNSFDTSGAGEKECFRVKNFTDGETLALLGIWSEKSDGDNLDHIRVVVASDAHEMFPAEYRAVRGATITTYRNNPEPLLYLETKVESDEQGLKNLFTLRDVNFLDGTFDSDGLDVQKTLVLCALKAAGADSHAARELFLKRITAVFSGLRKGGVAVPVRKFVSFALNAAVELASGPGSLEADEMDRLVGSHHVHLDMFPDEIWRRDANDGRISRRLTQNILHSELASSHANDLDQEKLVATCKRVWFRDLNNDEFDDSENGKWRKKCAAYCENPVREIREGIPYYIFEQLFSRDTKGLPLGERAWIEIDEADPSRGLEYEGLSVKLGLNRRDRDDAQKFLDAEPDDETQTALRDVLTKQTRRMVEKAANPTPETFTNPFLKLAEVARSMRQSASEDDRELILDLRLGRNADLENPAIGLFAFFYGPTFASLIEGSHLSTDAFRLSVDNVLIVPQSPPPLMTEPDEDPESDIVEPADWQAVPLEFALRAEGVDGDIEVEPALEWAPESIERYALLWLMLADEQRPDSDQFLTIPHGLSFDAWISEIAQRVTSLKSLEHKHFDASLLENELVRRLCENRDALSDAVRENGISAAAFNDAFDTWNELLCAAKEQFVPDGRADPRLEVFLRSDCVAGSSGESMLMLGTHPLKLRWIAQYLDKSEEIAEKALEGDLPVNSQNETLYLDWLSSRSPQQQPAVHISASGQHLMSSGDVGLMEEYHLPSGSPDSEYSESFSPQITAEIVSQIITYLETHPYKKDGLSVLVMTPTAPRFAADLVTAIRKGEWSSLRVSIHLATPKLFWESATNHIERVPSDTRMTGNRKVSPPLELTLYDFSSDASPAELFKDLQVDLAVVPQFFHGSPDIQENTEPSRHEIGVFNPLIDQPTYVYGGTQGGVISVSQRPRNPDPSLAAWSSMVVRQHRRKPVSSQQPENSDFLELRLDFHKASALFTDLHGRAHWVITVERYITREQIEELDNRPDILSVRDRVGPGNIYTMIVSSDAGRHFITRRLERRLSQIVEDSGKDPNRITTPLAEKIYDETREIAPRLALKAMGISRVTEEILGLAVGRGIIASRMPASVTRGIVAWISLDEHQDWFGGSASTRADLCRITLDYSGDKLAVDLLVAETKLRKGGYDAHGVTQVEVTMELLKGFLVQNNADNLKIDSQMWRELLLAAIETANNDAVQYFGSHSEGEIGSGHRLPIGIRNEFRNGNFQLRSVEGLYSICIYGKDQLTGLTTSEEPSGVSVIRSSGSQLLALISGESEVPEPGHITPLAENSSNAATNEPADGNQQPNETDASLQQPEEPGQSGDEDDQEPLPSAPVTGVPDSPPVSVFSAEPSGVGLNEKELDERYQAILDTYSEFEVPVHKPETKEDWYVEGPASILFRLTPGHGVDVKKISDKAENLRLKLKLEESQNVRFSIDKGFITIDVPKSFADRYFVAAQDLWNDWSRPEKALAAPLGQDRFGKPVDINFSSSNSPHLLIGGTTGSGKSEALNTILGGLVKHYSADELRLMLVDPKGTELQHLAEDEHLEGEIGWDDDEAIELLTKVVGEMERRYSIFKEARKRSLPEYNSAVTRSERVPWWFVVLDEYADLTSDSDKKKKIEACLKRLAQKARAAGIHVVIATQRPSADVISSNLRSNLPAQLALKVKSATESRVIMDETGAETLNGMGDSFLKSEGNIKRVQCAKI